MSVLNINNIDVAILCKVNELAARFGLRAGDAEALILYKDDEVTISFPSEPVDVNKRKKYVQMLKLIGCVNDSITVKDSVMIEDILDKAITLAPSRFGTNMGPPRA